MEQVRKQQLWKNITGRVLNKHAELAETYDMTSQKSSDHAKKRTFPIRKVGSARLVNSGAGPAKGPDVNEEPVSGEQPKSLPQMSAPKPHVDVSSHEPPKLVSEKKASRYALPERELYPLDNYVQVKTAAAYFDDVYKFMAPPDRHEYASNLTKRAHELGIYPGELAEKYGSATYAPEHDIAVCIDARRSNLLNEDHVAVLDKLAEIRFALPPEDFAVALHEFDKMACLDQHYGDIPDAYFTTFGKTAAQGNEEDPEAAIVIGNEYITRRRLTEYLKNNAATLKLRFGDETAEEMAKDPQAIFNSMPRDQKLVIMRMANNDDAPVRQGFPTA
jgi:hypothetical protein